MIKHLIGAALAAALLASVANVAIMSAPKPAHALPMAAIGNPAVLSSPYVGPGDINTHWLAWCGPRAFTTAIATAGTQTAWTVRRASDSTTQNIPVTSSGGLNTATLSSFLASTTGSISKCWDQTGNSHDPAQPTSSKQPSVTLSALGTLPAMTVASASFQTLDGGALSSSQPFSVFAVCKATSSTNAFILGLNSATNPTLIVNPGGTSWGASILGGVTVSAALNTWHAAGGMFNNASSSLTIDVTSNSGSVGSTQGVGHLWVFSNQDANGYLDGSCTDIGIMSGDQSASFPALIANARKVYGF